MKEYSQQHKEEIKKKYVKYNYIHREKLILQQKKYENDTKKKKKNIISNTKNKLNKKHLVILR